MLPRGGRVICLIYLIYHMFLGLDLHYTDPAQPLITAAWDLDDLYGGGHLSVRRRMDDVIPDSPYLAY